MYLNHPYTTIDNELIANNSVGVVGDNSASSGSNDDFDEHPEAPVLDATASGPSGSDFEAYTTSLPSRRKTRTTSHKVFSQLKVITDKMYNLPELRDDVANKLASILADIHGFENEVYGGDELGVCERIICDDVPAVAAAAECLNIYKELPRFKGKRKHPFSGRYGSGAETMKKQFQVNVPVPKLTDHPDNNCLVVEGTGDVFNMLEFDEYDHRDFEMEEMQLVEDVVDCLEDVLDMVDRTEAVDGDDDFEF